MSAKPKPKSNRAAAARERAASAADRGDNRRASPEAVEKRRAARLFNKAMLGEGRGGRSDGRTERRRRRLLEELAKGAARGGKRELKPIDVLARVQELIALGEPLASIRKACPKPRPVEATPELIEGVRRIHEAYAFPADAYAFVGVDTETLHAAGVLPARAERTRPGLRRTGIPPARRRGAA
ncbi:MAG: hypothetical protein QM820_32030 [Minicystis sp.]